MSNVINSTQGPEAIAGVQEGTCSDGEVVSVIHVHDYSKHR